MTEHIEQLVKVIQLYFTQLDSEIPIHTQGLVLKNLPESTTGLPNLVYLDKEEMLRYYYLKMLMQRLIRVVLK